jgi:enamine deaminase RidA (YjgF/YER057c/UK114 family)
VSHRSSSSEGLIQVKATPETTGVARLHAPGMIFMPLVDAPVCRSFRGASGDAEHYIALTAPPNLPLHAQIDNLAQRYAEAVQTLRLAPESGIFRRIYVSDAINQSALLHASSLFTEPLDNPVAVSLVEQPPLPNAKLAMLAYHVESASPLLKRVIAPNHLLVEKRGLGHLWSTRLCTADIEGRHGAGAQTHEVFSSLINALATCGASLADNCVRTWIYVKDVDFFYRDMVAARRELFASQGLTRDTHYIASTGIEGACGHRYDLVLMDAYSILGLAPNQVSFLNDFSRLCPTADYEVTFERGTRIAYADRAHHFISGTASIDASGKVVHPGDVMRQLDRALENVESLLRSGGATLDDMTHLIVYLRDPSDYPRIEAALADRFPDIPRLILRGAVCRPEWLVEIEGIACTAENASNLPAF